MKKIVFVLGCLVFGLFLAPLAMAGGDPGTGINLSPHDLHGYTPVPDDGLGRICVYCHTPHHAYKLSGVLQGTGPTAPDAYDYLPLWNHDLSNNLAFDTYYNGPGAPTVGPKASQAIQNGMTIGSSSLLCLGCHDGSVAINSYGTGSTISRSAGASFVLGGRLIGKDAYLGNHHPIGFDYYAVSAVDTEIRDPDIAMLASAGTVSSHLYGSGNTQMECATCHSVHNKGNTGERLLWRSDASSRLCLTCHDKGDYDGTTP